MGKVYARAIHNGKKTLDDVPARYVEETKKAYKELYGKELKGQLCMANALITRKGGSKKIKTTRLAICQGGCQQWENV